MNELRKHDDVTVLLVCTRQGSVAAAASVVGAVEDVEPIALLIDYDNPDNVFEIYET